jgi:tRNA A-37 threonylcarbamoyl transferase component Bud32
LLGNETYRLAGSRYSAVFTSGVPVETAREWLASPERLFAGGPEFSGRARARTTRASTPAGELFVKNQRRPLHRALLDLLAGRPTAAARAFATGLELAAKGVDAARPVALLERRFPVETFLLLEYVAAPDLRQFTIRGLSALSSSTARREFKSSLWRAVGRSVAALHSAAVRQRDLKAPNLLISHDSEGAPRLVFVDLEGMERLADLPSRRRRTRDLARLAVSLRETSMQAAGVGEDDWTELLEVYLDACAPVFGRDPDLSSWRADTVGWAHRKAARNVRRERPIA